MRLDQVIQGNDVVQQHVAAERDKQALTAVSPMARRAIRQEILPQIEESVVSPESAEDICESTKRDIEEAFTFKNEIYTRLISYKSIDQSDQQYLEDLLIVMDEWLRSTTATLQDDASDSGKQEIEVTVKVETEPSPSESPKKEPTTQSRAEKREIKKELDTGTKEIVLLDTSSGEAVPITFDDIFDLQDVRL